MLEVTELKNGTYYQENNTPFKVIEYDHVKMGRGNAKIKLRVRNLLTGAVIPVTYITGKRVEEAEIEEVRAVFKYRTNTDAIFSSDNYEDDLELPINAIENQAPYLQKGMNVIIALFKGEAIDVTLPIKAIYTVKEAPPDARGNTAGASTKDVVLENSVKIRTPMFIKTGDKVVVDTRSGTYIERA